MNNVKFQVLTYLDKAGIVLNEEEKETIEITDFGLENLYDEGLQLVVYINNERYCAKELIMLPNQTCPEHRHPRRSNDQDGKQETFRCRFGIVYLYIEGNEESQISVEPPAKHAEYYTARKEIILYPGDQYTIPADTNHWFKAGPKGAVISEFSSNSDDSSDIFTNSHIVR
ncbi:D-lyxose/D-mannose family sugar isomerase [Priestia megaterium]|uniref:D-lyxose/D-mannose family sugar isomerase n=1 Tax=Priestia megaterium TaxID=1404 RepID=UPI00249C73F0|nr:D-lyxose/D-mannose family sugar isomerase [Priestia megaterium]MDI3089710.1 D-lyxose/D-mannose family sugar isomerase [Priestia megaterium]